MNETLGLQHNTLGSILQLGDEYAREYRWNEAECLYFGGLSRYPSNPVLLRRIGDLYRAQNREDDALLCYRGVIPESANEHYFESKVVAPRIVPVDQAPETTLIPASPSENFPLKKPIRHGSQAEFNQFNRIQTESLGSFVTVSQSGQVWFDGANTLTLTRTGEILKEHIKGNEFLACQAAAAGTPVNLRGRACFIDARSSKIYYHWMLDVLPKLTALEKAGIDLQSIDTFIAHTPSDYQVEALGKFGIPPEKIQSCKTRQHYTADELIVPFLKNDLGQRIYTGLGLGLDSWIPDSLRQRFTPKRPASADRKIFISRQQATSRRLINDAEIHAVLARHGFEVHQLESLTVQQQADLMSEACIVAGVHGAGLTNLVFCQPGTTVLEIFGDYVVPCYWSLANLANCHYHQFMAADNTIGHGKFQEKHLKDRRAGDLYIDPEQFDASLAAI